MKPVQNGFVLPQITDVLLRRVSEVFLLRQDDLVRMAAELNDLPNLVDILAGVLVSALVVVDAQDFAVEPVVKSVE